MTNKVPRFTGYNSPSGWRGRDGVRVESGGYTKEGRSGRSKKVGETVIARSYGGIGKEWMDSASEKKQCD